MVHERMDSTDIRFDFNSLSPRNTLNGNTTRIFDKECDLYSIVSSLSSSIEELQLTCLNVNIYGNTKTTLKFLSIETVYSNLYPKSPHLWKTRQHSQTRIKCKFCAHLFWVHIAVGFQIMQQFSFVVDTAKCRTVHFKLVLFTF